MRHSAQSSIESIFIFLKSKSKHSIKIWKFDSKINSFSITQNKDDDECALGRHNCIKPYECRNTKGSFRCEKPRYTTTSTTSTTTTSTTTTKRPYIHTQYYPSYTQSFSSRLNVWPHTTQTPVTRHIDYDQRYGPCTAGLQRSDQGACIGKSEDKIFIQSCLNQFT